MEPELIVEENLGGHLTTEFSVEEISPKKINKYEEEEEAVAGVPLQQPDHILAGVDGQAAGRKAGLEYQETHKAIAGVHRPQPDHIPADVDGLAVGGVAGLEAITGRETTTLLRPKLVPISLNTYQIEAVKIV